MIHTHTHTPPYMKRMTKQLLQKILKTGNLGKRYIEYTVLPPFQLSLKLFQNKKYKIKKESSCFVFYLPSTRAETALRTCLSELGPFPGTQANAREYLSG